MLIPRVFALEATFRLGLRSVRKTTGQEDIVAAVIGHQGSRKFGAKGWRTFG